MAGSKNKAVGPAKQARRSKVALTLTLAMMLTFTLQNITLNIVYINRVFAENLAPSWVPCSLFPLLKSIPTHKKLITVGGKKKRP